MKKIESEKIKWICEKHLTAVCACDIIYSGF